LRLTVILGYHFDEPSIIDVTNDGILTALEDGRMGKIANEYIKYDKEKEAN